MKADETIYVLIACEESQAECMAFRKYGAIAYSCDIQPCKPKGRPEWHIQGDVTRFLKSDRCFVTQSGEYNEVPRWDLIVAHPPCTYLCKVGSLWMRKKAEYKIIHNGRYEKVNFWRYHQMLAARDFFHLCLNARADYVAVENPLPMMMAGLPPASCYIQPSWFGVKYTKKTLYWLRNLPPLMPEIEYPNPRSYVSCSRGKYRSRTFPEVADAMARQWLSFIREQEGYYK